MGEKLQEYRKLNMEELKSRITTAISTEEALKDIEPMEWPDEVMSGQQKVIISRSQS